MPAKGEKRQGDGDGDQDDDDPFQEFHAVGAGSVGHLAIDALQSLELPEDARVPGL